MKLADLTESISRDEIFAAAMPSPALESARTAYFDSREAAERDFLEHADSEMRCAGVTPEEWERQVQKRMKTAEVTDVLAERLECAGKIAFGTAPFFKGKVYIHSRKVVPIPDLRRICLLPSIAGLVRASKLAALEYYLQRNKYCQFWTFTTGERCGLEGLRKRMAYLHRRLSKLNAYLRERYSVEIVFRSTEFGSVKFDGAGKMLNDDGEIEFGPDGEPLFHVHAHCVVRSLIGWRPKAKWQEVINAVWDFWGHNWDADGQIRNARECCKYVTKHGDLLKLTPEQLGKMHEAVFRMKLCQPMGTLKEEIATRKNGPVRKILRRYSKKDGGSEWREKLDHNQHAPTTEEEREAADNFADAEAMAEETAKAARIRVTPTVDFEETTYMADGAMHRETRHAPELGVPMRETERARDICRVLARCSPSVGPSGRKEPCVVIGYTRLDMDKVMSHPLVAKLWAQTVQAWEEGLGIRVHTGTPTVPTDEGGEPHLEFAEAFDPGLLESLAGFSAQN